MAPTLLSDRAARAIACLAALLSLTQLAPVAAQTMVPDSSFHPQFRARANVRVFPQRDETLAATGATYLGGVRAPEVFRFSADGTVLDDGGPRVTITTPRSDIVCTDGRRVTLTIETVSGSFEPVGFTTTVTTRDATGSQLGVVIIDQWEFTPGSMESPGSALAAFKLVELADGRVMVGGVSGLARINSDGTRDAGFAVAFSEGDGPFRDLLALPDGTVVVALGGNPVTDNFGTHVEGPATLRRVRPDGTWDPAYSVILDEPTLHIALPDGGLIAGTTRLQRLRADGAIDPAFGPSPPSLARILSIHRLDDGALLVSGGYADDRPSVFILSADGALLHDLLTCFPESEAVVLDGVDTSGRAWLRHGRDGWVYRDWVEGLVAVVNAPAAIARVPVSGAAGILEPVAVTITPTPRIDGTVATLSCDDSGRIVISGAFDWIDDVAHAHIARLSSDGSVDHTFAPDLPAVVASVAAVHGDGRVLVRLNDGSHLRLLSDGSVDSSLPDDCKLNESMRRIVHAVTSDGGYLVSEWSAVDVGPASMRLQKYASSGACVLDVPDPAGVSRIDTLAERTDGAIVVLGWLAPDGSAALPAPDYRVFAVLPDGSLDPAYHLALPAGTAIDRVLLFPDGGALISADLPGDLVRQYQLLRFAPDGRLDEAFATLPDERTMLAGLHLHPQADGSVLAEMPGFLGDENNILMRWLRDGTPTAGFRPAVPLTGVASALLTPLGDLYAVGHFDSGSSVTPLARWTVDRRSDFLVHMPQSQALRAGDILVLDASASAGIPHTYQWSRDGIDIPGAVSARLVVDRASIGDAGTYRCRVRFATFDFSTPAAVVTVTPNDTKFVNFSARSRVAVDKPQIGGIVVDDPAGQRALLRAIGNALPFELRVPLLPDPVLTLFERKVMIAQDQGGVWAEDILDLGRTLGAFTPRWPWPDDPGATPTNSALSIRLPPGVYTAHTTSGDRVAGVSLFEYYDADPSGPGRGVRNLSIRAITGPGANVLIPGFVVRGHGTLRVLARAVGPSLAAFGVSDAAADPRMILHAHDRIGAVDAVNDDWSGDPAIVAAAAEVGAFPLDPASKDAALLITLSPGAYTIQVPAADAESGEVLVELYVIDP